MTERGHLPAALSSEAEVQAFLRRAAALVPARAGEGTRGRLMFAMDATASREPTWDHACRIQGEMFSVAEALGGLSVQLVFYRGFGECRASPWVAGSDDLLRRMVGVRCHAGQTQLGRVLAHCAAETRRQRVNALVFVGDCFEEDLDAVAERAGELGLLGVPAFLFHEGGNPAARRAFETIARLTGGACCPFDAASARQLRDLLGAVAAYAAGGRAALEHFGRDRDGAVRLLIAQVGRPGAGA